MDGFEVLLLATFVSIGVVGGGGLFGAVATGG
jgi:hypothetical protein